MPYFFLYYEDLNRQLLCNNYNQFFSFYFSVPSPHHTPPPSTQRQGVIQRHNTHTGQTHNNKPPSPATSGKLHHIQSPIHHYPPPGKILYLTYKVVFEIYCLTFSYSFFRNIPALKTYLKLNNQTQRI